MANHFRVEVKESEAELRHRLGRARTASSKERLQMLLWIKTKSIRTRQHLCQRLGRNESTIYRWLQRYYAGGIEGLLEVQQAPGRSAKIPAEVVEQLQQRLANPQGFESYRAIHQWLEQEHEIKVAYRTVHQLVRYTLKAKLKVPRPQSPQASVEDQQTFKKKLPDLLNIALKHLGNGLPMRYGCQDESRFGLKTIVGRLMTLCGVIPQGHISWQRDNFYVYALVEPLTRECFFWEFSHLDTLCFQAFIDLFAQQYPQTLNIIQLDNGAFHTTDALVGPSNVILLAQPPYSPQLNPIERLWEYLKQGLVWQSFESLEPLRGKVESLLNGLSAQLITSWCGWDFITDALLSASS